MRILVTGGAGFIASHITAAYIKLGHKVVVVDSMHHGFKQNINPKAKFYQADIRDLTAIRKIMQTEKPEIINHHAAIAEVVKSVTDPIPTLEVNVQGTVNLLLTGMEIKIKKFIFASTGGAIYGDPGKYPISERVNPEPLSPYGLSKLLGEKCIEYYARVGKFNYTIFRYPNVYGPRQDPHGEAGVVAIFSEKIRQNVNPTIYGDGSKTRDYTYVADIVQANVIGLKKGDHLTVNLGLGKEISDQMVYDTISANFKHAPTAKYKAVRTGEALRSCLNARKARAILNWKPKYNFKEGIKEYLKITSPSFPLLIGEGCLERKSRDRVR
ncbi:MAG: NAD-dependent epimerase/dehydratase family protein [Patescibacteria group bacterium]|jgi:UDP-glucose 4-epimerase